MTLPVKVTFRNMAASDAVAQRIRLEAARLDRHFKRILNCGVIVEAPHRHHRRGEHFHVRIDLGVPGDVIVVEHEPNARNALLFTDSPKCGKHSEIDGAHKDVYVAIRDAFRAVRRRLDDYARRLRGDVKMHGRITATRAVKLGAPNLAP